MNLSITLNEYKLRIPVECWTLNQIKDFIQEYFPIKEEYRDSSHAKQRAWDICEDTTIELKWYGEKDDDYPTEIRLTFNEFKNGVGYTMSDYLRLEWDCQTDNEHGDWYAYKNDWYDIPSNQKRLISKQGVLDEMLSFILKNEKCQSVIRDIKLKSIGIWTE